MTLRVKGPNGLVFTFPADVAKSLVGSGKGGHVFVTDEAPEPEKAPEPKPAKKPRKRKTA